MNTKRTFCNIYQLWPEALSLVQKEVSNSVTSTEVSYDEIAQCIFKIGEDFLQYVDDLASSHKYTPDSYWK